MSLIDLEKFTNNGEMTTAFSLLCKKMGVDKKDITVFPLAHFKSDAHPNGSMTALKEHLLVRKLLLKKLRSHIIAKNPLESPSVFKITALDHSARREKDTFGTRTLSVWN